MRYCNIIFDQSLNLREIENPRFTNLEYILRDTRQYKYKTDMKGLKLGDLVVVPTQNGFSIGVFVRYDPILNGRKAEDIKPVIQKVDLDNYLRQLAKEKEKEEILAQMEERRKALEEKYVYEMLAEKDPKMAELLSAFDSLTKDE